MFFFFFQAEDGIRDYKVTGVQTCALPISYTAVDVTDGNLPVPGNAQVTFGNGSGNACGQNVTPPAGLNGYTATPWATGFKDRKSTRLNSSHLVISYAVFCLKKKRQNNVNIFSDDYALSTEIEFVVTHFSLAGVR